MYVPWEPLDVVLVGRENWKGRNTIMKKLFDNNPLTISRKNQAPFVTAYGVLVAKKAHGYLGVTPKLQKIYDDLLHPLLNILVKYKIDKKNAKTNYMATHSFLRRSIAYSVSSDLYNKVVGAQNGKITALSTRLSESSLSATDRFRIERMIANANDMICMYDFDRDYLYKPPR